MLKINKINFELFSRATEDVNEVKKSLLNTLPSSLRDNVKSKIKFQELEGHFKESIILIELIIKGKDAECFFDYLIKNLSIKLTQEDFLKRYDEEEGNFFIRLDKQLMHQSDSQLILLNQGDIIKIKISFQGFPLKTTKLIEYLKENEYIQ